MKIKPLHNLPKLYGELQRESRKAAIPVIENITVGENGKVRIDFTAAQEPDREGEG